ncbi:hypothetical protein NOC27_2506 [Nitrosococcus oceani AFC27]|nr:hypothetical protein NOC27_2506 [Nitrosococcus oceani AFC27]
MGNDAARDGTASIWLQFKWRHRQTFDGSTVKILPSLQSTDNI